MDDNQRPITDDTLLSDLTVGEFKALVRQLLTEFAAPTASTPPKPEGEPARMTLDDLMSDFGN